MACRWTELVIDARDPRGLAEWWAQVLDYRVNDESSDDEVEICSDNPRDVSLLFVSVPESKTVKDRLHIDLRATDRDQDAELERLLSLGAKPVDVGQGDVTWHVLADPEGNEFCLLRTRAEP